MASAHDGGRAPRLTTLLGAAATAVYLLVVVGATTALLDGAGACSTWPVCEGRVLAADVGRLVADLGLLAAWGHRIATLLTGGLLAVTAAVAVRAGVDRRTGLALATVLVLYPLQVGLGALVAVTGAPVTAATVHLVLGMTIVAGTLLALLFHLEAAGVAPFDVDRAAASRETADPAGTSGGTDPASGRADQSPPSLTTAERVRAYVRLTKPKLWWLLCLVALATMVMADGWALDPVLAVATLLGGVLAVGASGTFNNVFERDVDRRMDRTDDRPLVTGQIPVRRALAFGIALALASVAVFVTFVNVLAAGLGLLAILFYSVVYTLLLKPNTPQNTVLGGAVGAFPALIGWAAVEGAVELPAFVLGVVVFCWTPAHFYNLALAYRADYDRADIPMLPVVRSAETTYRHVLAYLGATMLSVVALGALTDLGWVYAGTATVVGAVFLWAVVRLVREGTRQAAFRAFHASNAYLGALLVAIVVVSLL